MTAFLLLWLLFVAGLTCVWCVLSEVLRAFTDRSPSARHPARRYVNAAEQQRYDEVAP